MEGFATLLAAGTPGLLQVSLAFGRAAAGRCWAAGRFTVPLSTALSRSQCDERAPQAMRKPKLYAGVQQGQLLSVDAHNTEPDSHARRRSTWSLMSDLGQVRI